MKIAMVTPWAVRCGIYSYSRDLGNALAEKGVDVYIIRLPRFGRKTPEAFQIVYEKIPLDRVDLIHVQHEYGLYAQLEGGFYGFLDNAGKPVVTTMHSVGQFLVDRVVADVSEKVVVHNEFCRKRFGYKSRIIPHGCTPSETTPADEAKHSYQVQEGAPVVGYCGFISTYKGLETLIEAMEKVKAILIVGGGWHAGPGTDYIRSLQERSNVLEHRCKWLGFVPDGDLKRAYGAMDVVVYPSRFATESGALLMALSHGKAVIARNLPPFREKEKLGALATFKNVRSLRRKINAVLRDEAYRFSLEEAARSYAEANNWGNVADKHIELYESLT